MLPLAGMGRWMFVVETAILFYGIFLKSNICESSDHIQRCRQKNVLFIGTKQIDPSNLFPSDVVYREVGGIKLCFHNQKDKTHKDCCRGGDFICEYTDEKRPDSSIYSIFLNKEVLFKQDIVLMTVPDIAFSCMPSKFYNKNSGFLLNVHNCLNKGTTNIRLSQNTSCGNSSYYVKGACNETNYKFTVDVNNKVDCVPCKSQENVSTTESPSVSHNGTRISLEGAVNILKNLSSMLGHSNLTAIEMGNVIGMITKLPPKDQTDINIGMTTSGDISILKDNTDLGTGFSRLVQLPKEASDMAVKTNGSFVGVLFFSEMYQDDPSSFFLNNELLGIEMGAKISNLSHTIDINFRNVDKKGMSASCRSWDGEGKEAIWTRDGCQTNEINDSITCQCSHLTFFAILLSPPPGNITSSDFTSLTYITSIGCGLSMFFLTVALFMHCLMRKRKASQTTKILINLFVAMFTLNLSFLTNESIANLGIFSACVAMAAFMHYSMLATFSWFFIQALHLYFNLRKIPNEIKHYMTKMCVTGWVAPAVVVIALLAFRKYDYMVIYTNDGTSTKMCWISDAVVHQGVNVGYYAIVFIFTLSVFIITVRQIVLLNSTARKTRDQSSIKTNSFSILGLFLMFGITWAFAFFSHGPLLIASYYIFTILNSFQGFFLFIYYYNSSKTSGEDRSASTVSSSTSTLNTVVTSPYQ